MEKCKLRISVISNVNKHHTELPNLLSEKMPYLQQFLKCLTVLYNIPAESHVLPKLSCHPTSGTTSQPRVWIAPRGTGQSLPHTRSYDPCKLSACTQVVGHVIAGRELQAWFASSTSALVLLGVPVRALGYNHWGGDSSVWESCSLMGWCNLTPNTKCNTIHNILIGSLKTLRDPRLLIETSRQGGKGSQLSWPLLRRKAEELYPLEKFLQNTCYSRRITSTCDNWLLDCSSEVIHVSWDMCCEAAIVSAIQGGNLLKPPLFS